ncbi:glycosyltransferase [Halorubrum sodomense]|uniref:Glycosyltransferase, catalytic subunit of cellulose synthase and poly-beta-1,6-N-acetylglucosamine synthase n=1 Tax=Halorubrum sodomense TaxID=35743 RepID=A0A1I6FM36_HALSD|nr:glycosyltransferase family 2 protein [Halorubrum sodomense]SFR30877.1 Glycosyltransferase, catalytic subunit of cellulose synthase and poly-beta-1,6-N-acetylglucosamine synthase [Halorubrum sodomense]
MNTERVALVAVTLALVVGGVATLLAPTVVSGPGAAPGQASATTAVTDGGLGSLFGVALWGVTLLFGATALVWFVLTTVVGAGYETPPNEYGLDEVQIRIMTVDAAEVVQETVDSLPDGLDDVHVIAESPIDVRGATVHAVPDEFSCHAVRKGRAQEWARRALDCRTEFVLYLDEDSVVESFDGLPDADIVQLREKPRRTDSSLSYLADVYRMGVQIEQRAFARLSIPLFAWGGGIAVRTEIEEKTTWDRETLVEDTAFVWAAFRELDVTFALSDAVCRNEAPPSLYEILQQRRRWAAGNVQASTMLPLRYELLTRVRNYAWALSPIVTLLVVPLSLLSVTIAYSGLFFAASMGLALCTLGWFLLGVAYYGDDHHHWALAVPLAPLITVVHSMGTVAGILNPPETFRVTTKVGSD